MLDSLPTPLPPLILFGFNRPELLAQTLAGLRQQTQLPDKIIAYVDGPRRGAQSAEDQADIDENIRLLEAFQESMIEIHRRDTNMGCNGNILSALSEVLQQYDTIVVLEDDSVPAPPYFETMCRLLEQYRSEPSIFSISPYPSHFYQENFIHNLTTDVFITNRFNPVGYATWADRWTPELFEHLSKRGYNPFGRFYNIPILANTLNLVLRQYDIENTLPDEWSIALILHSLYNQWSHVCLSRSLIVNIGFGHPKAANTKLPTPKANKYYQVDFTVNTLPQSLALENEFTRSVTTREFVQFLIRMIKFMPMVQIKKYLGENVYYGILQFRARVKYGNQRPY